MILSHAYTYVARGPVFATTGLLLTTPYRQEGRLRKRKEEFRGVVGREKTGRLREEESLGTAVTVEE